MDIHWKNPSLVSEVVENKGGVFSNIHQDYSGSDQMGSKQGRVFSLGRVHLICVLPSPSVPPARYLKIKYEKKPSKKSMVFFKKSCFLFGEKYNIWFWQKSKFETSKKEDFFKIRVFFFFSKLYFFRPSVPPPRPWSGTVTHKSNAHGLTSN